MLAQAGRTTSGATGDSASGIQQALTAESAALRAHVAAVGELKGAAYRELLAGLIVDAATGEAALRAQLDQPPLRGLPGGAGLMAASRKPAAPSGAPLGAVAPRASRPAPWRPAPSRPAPWRPAPWRPAPWRPAPSRPAIPPRPATPPPRASLGAPLCVAGGLALAATALVPAVAAAGTDEGGLLLGLWHREMGAALGYDRVAHLDPLLTTLRGQETDHAAAIATELAAVGLGTPRTPEWVSEVDAGSDRLARSANAKDAIAAATLLEQDLVAVYQSAVVALVDPKIAMTAATIPRVALPAPAHPSARD